MKAWWMERNEIHVKGVAISRGEIAHIRQLEEMKKGSSLVLDHCLMMPIHDLDTRGEWRTRFEFPEKTSRTAKISNDNKSCSKHHSYLRTVNVEIQ